MEAAVDAKLVLHQHKVPQKAVESEGAPPVQEHAGQVAGHQEGSQVLWRWARRVGSVRLTRFDS